MKNRGRISSNTLCSWHSWHWLRRPSSWAAAASLVLYRVLINRPQNAKAAATTVQIALANRDLELGTVLKDSDVKLTDWPGAVPLGATSKPQDLIGRGVTTTIYAKEPIIE